MAAAPEQTSAAVDDETAPLLPTASAENAENADEVAQRTNVSQTTFNMINCFVGAGILTVPFAFRLAGYSAGMLLMFVAGLNWYTSLLLGKALDHAASENPDVPYRSWNMGQLARAAFGPAGDNFICVIFGLELWFALETFLVLSGISVNLLTGVPEPTVIAVAGTIGSLSMCLPSKTISHTSALAVACMVGGLLALIICGLGRVYDHASNVVPSAEVHRDVDWPRVPASLGMFLYCFSGLPCLPSIRSAMQRPKEDYAMAVHYAFFCSSIYYMAIGMLGYAFFANDTRRSFLKDLTPVPGEGHSNIYGYVAAAAAGLFALKLQAGFPLYAAPILDAFGLSEAHGLETKKVALARALFCAVSVMFAIFARHQIDAVAEIMGAFLTNSTSILFPVAAYLRVAGRHEQKMSKSELALLYGLLIFGCVYGVIGTCSTIHSFLYGRSIHVGQAVAGYVASTPAPQTVVAESLLRLPDLPTPESVIKMAVSISDDGGVVRLP